MNNFPRGRNAGALPCPQCSASECQVTAEALWKHGPTFALWGARQLLTRLETLSQEPGAQDRQAGAPALHPGSRGACTQDIHLSGCFPFSHQCEPKQFPRTSCLWHTMCELSRPWRPGMSLTGAVGQTPFPKRVKVEVGDDTG